MTDLVSTSQHVSISEEAAEEPSEFTQYMRAAYWRHTDLKDQLARERAEHEETKRLLAKAQQEIEALRADLHRYQSGRAVVVEIEGRRFTLTNEALPPAPTFTVTDAWRKEEQNGHQARNPFADSFVL